MNFSIYQVLQFHLEQPKGDQLFGNIKPGEEKIKFLSPPDF